MVIKALTKSIRKTTLSHKERSCKVKKKYESSFKADLYLKAFNTLLDTRIDNSYYCVFCRKYHIGHISNRTKECIKPYATYWINNI